MMYDEPVFRPPSEASSLIIQITLGCSHNKCTFCGMYKTKQFRIKSWEEIKNDIQDCSKYARSVNRIFLADGDALKVDTDTLLKTLELLYKTFPHLERVSIYAGPLDILEKSENELVKLREAGLMILYMGIESGSDKILDYVKKGVDSRQMIEAGQKIMRTGLQLSATVITGLGGQEWWEEHAVESARIASEINPTYLAALTLMVVPKTVLYKQVERGEFKLLDTTGVLKELKLMLENVELTNCIFRSNHASNYLPLRGKLNRDRDELVRMLDNALKNPDNAPLRPEFLRGL